MPETTPYIDNSVIGFDPQSNLKLQVDTYNRLSPILNMQDHPMFTGAEPSALRDNFAPASTTQRTTLPDISIADAISSRDSSIQEMGRNSMEQWMDRNVPEYRLGLGRTVETPYEQGKKFLNKKFGFSAFSDNENLYYQDEKANTSWVGRNLIRNPLKFIGRVAGETLTKLGEGLGYMGSMLTSIGSDNYFEKVADNGFSRWFEKQEDWLKNDLIPVYKAAGFDEKGFFAKLGDWTFWNDSVADAAAFMTSFAAQTLLTGGVGELAGLGRIGSLGINTASRLGKFGKGLDFGIKFLTGAEDVTGIGNWAFNTASESFFESAGVFKETKQDLIDQRRAGKNNYSDAEIETIASKRAAYDFKGNLMALTFSNAFENKFLFQPLRRYIRGTGAVDEANIGRTRINMKPFSSNAEESLAAEVKKFDYATKIGKYLDYKNPQGRLQFYGLRALGATAIEGLYEENIQLAMERLSRYGSYEGKKLGEAISATGGQVAKQTQAAFQGKDPEAAESIGLGALIGIGGTSIISKFFGGQGFATGERRTEISRADSAVRRYNSLKKEWLSLGDIYERNEDGTFKKDAAGGFVIDEKKVEAKAAGLSEALKRVVLPDEISNPVSRKLIQDDVLSEFVHAIRTAGIDNSVLSRIQTLKGKSASEMEALGFNPAETNSTAEEMANNISSLIDMHKESFKSTVKKPGYASAKEYAENEQQRRYSLYRAKALAWAAGNAFRTIDDAIIGENVRQPLDIDNDPGVQQYNSLQIQLAKLNQFNDVLGKHSDFYKDHVRQRRAEITAAIKELGESLQDKVDDGTLVAENGQLLSPEKRDDYVKGHLDLLNQIQHATARNSMAQWNYTADKLANLNNGYDNFQDWLDFQDGIEKKDEAVDEKEAAPKHTVQPNEDGTFSVVSPEGEVVGTPTTTAEAAQEVATTLDNTENVEQEVEQPEIKQEEVAVIQKDVDIEPEEEHLDVATQLEEPVVNALIPDEVSDDKPLSWAYPDITSKRDTINISPEEEQLSTDDYSLMRADFIKEFFSPGFNDRYKLFIVRDTFPEIYKDVKVDGKNIVIEEDGKWRFVDPSVIGEVVILQNFDGTPAKVGDFFKTKWKEFADQPVIFSFDQNVFFGPLYSGRVEIKARRKNLTYEQADEENRAFRAQADEARRQIREGEKDKVQVQMMHYTGGIHPKTKWAPVGKRFGEFSFEIVLPTVGGGKTSEQFGGKYAPGTVVAKIKGVNFPISTSNLASNSEILAKIQRFLEYEYPSIEAAKNVRDNMLSILVGTNNKQFFTIDKKGDAFIINFRKARPEDLDKNEERAVIRQNGIISNDSIGDAKLNVSEEALRKGYKEFISPAEEGELLTKEDYVAFIKSKLITNLKKVIDKESNLHMETVNPYFSFIIQSSEKSTPVLQKNNYNSLKQRMIHLANTGSYDVTKILSGLNSELDKGNITQEQYDDLKAFSEKNIPTAGISEIDPLENAKKLFEAGTITEAAYNLMVKVAERAKAEKPVIAAEEVVEEKPPIPLISEQKKPGNLADKYKNKEKQDVGKIIAGQEQASSPVEYKVEDKYLYIPEKNVFIHISNGKKIAESRLPAILEKMVAQFPYNETSTGNTGFNVLALDDTHKIYAPPTRLPGAEIGVIDNSIVNVESMIAKSLSEEDKVKAEEFLKRWCR